MPNKIQSKEQDSDRQFWLPASEPMSNAEKISRALRPASRFKSPLSLSEKIKAIFEQKMHIFFKSAEFSFDPQYPVPPEWQIIINYLFEQGILRQPWLQFEELFNDEPKIHMLRLLANYGDSLTDGGNPLNGDYSRGVSQDFEEAISKVIGELLERYLLAIYRDEKLIRGSIRNFKKKNYHFLDPFLLAPFSEEQKSRFPKRRFDENSIFRWVEGKSVMTGGKAYIPAQLVYWNYRHGPEEPFMQQSITNGAAGMFTLAEAILAGLYELIQRDAFFIYWFNKIAPPRINQDSIKNQDFKKLLADLKRYQIELEILDITADFGVPTFVAILIDSAGRGPAMSLGAGCGPNPERAIIRAVTEAIGVRHWLRSKFVDYLFLPEPYLPFTEAFSQEKRLLLWGNPAMRPKFDFFLGGPKVPLHGRHQSKIEENPEKELAELKQKLESRGEAYEIFYYECRHPVLEKLGYHSVSVSVPALLPLYMNETCAPLGSSRIKEACLQLGLKPPEEINDIPHPFP